MSVLKSRLDPASTASEQNAAHMRALVETLRERIAEAAQGGSEEARKRHVVRGRLLPRDRLQRLLDRDSLFLECSPLAALGVYADPAPGAGLIAGIGRVHGREVMVIVNDATVKGGTFYPMTVKKHLRAQEIAVENRLPCIYLVDSGGAFLTQQDEIFADRDHFGRVFYLQAHMAAQRIPQIAVVLGSSTAGGAYVPAMCDECIIVRGQGTIFLAGPPLVEAATGEVTDADALGGGEVHSRISGVADHLANDEEHALSLAREAVAHLAAAGSPSLKRRTPQEPIYPAEELYGIVPANLHRAFDMREIIARLVDASEFHELKSEYARSLVCGFTHLQGYPLGILANNGVLFTESARKGNQFIELCERRSTPMLFLQNVTGFMVGKQSEHAGIIKEGAKMIAAVACTRVPVFTLIIGASHGAGNYAMAGRAYRPRFLWTWPTACVSVMGGGTAAEVLARIKRDAHKAGGRPWTTAEEENLKTSIRRRYQVQGDPYYATARLWDDGIIDPIDTRNTLGLALDAVANAPPIRSSHG